MTAVKPVLEVYLALKFDLILSALLWFVARLVLAHTSFRLSYSTQLRVQNFGALDRESCTLDGIGRG